MFKENQIQIPPLVNTVSDEVLRNIVKDMSNGTAKVSTAVRDVNNIVVGEKRVYLREQKLELLKIKYNELKKYKLKRHKRKKILEEIQKIKKVQTYAMYCDGKKDESIETIKSDIAQTASDISQKVYKI